MLSVVQQPQIEVVPKLVRPLLMLQTAASTKIQISKSLSKTTIRIELLGPQ
jgi:hypothetical protein